jgi:hypothetical protein
MSAIRKLTLPLFRAQKASVAIVRHQTSGRRAMRRIVINCLAPCLALAVGCCRTPCSKPFDPGCVAEYTARGLIAGLALEPRSVHRSQEPLAQLCFALWRWRRAAGHCARRSLSLEVVRSPPRNCAQAGWRGPTKLHVKEKFPFRRRVSVLTAVVQPLAGASC